MLYEYSNSKGIRYAFEYDEEYLENGVPIGYHFPLTSAPFKWDSLHPTFENLASEGWLREVQAEKHGIDIEDTFGLLLACGKELVGALSIVPHEPKH